MGWQIDLITVHRDVLPTPAIVRCHASNAPEAIKSTCIMQNLPEFVFYELVEVCLRQPRAWFVVDLGILQSLLALSATCRSLRSILFMQVVSVCKQNLRLWGCYGTILSHKSTLMAFVRIQQCLCKAGKTPFRFLDETHHGGAWTWFAVGNLELQALKQFLFWSDTRCVQFTLGEQTMEVAQVASVW